MTTALLALDDPALRRVRRSSSVDCLRRVARHPRAHHRNAARPAAADLRLSAGQRGQPLHPSGHSRGTEERTRTCGTHGNRHACRARAVAAARCQTYRVADPASAAAADRSAARRQPSAHGPEHARNQHRRGYDRRSGRARPGVRRAPCATLPGARGEAAHAARVPDRDVSTSGRGIRRRAACRGVVDAARRRLDRRVAARSRGSAVRSGRARSAQKHAVRAGRDRWQAGALLGDRRVRVLAQPPERGPGRRSRLWTQRRDVPALSPASAGEIPARRCRRRASAR